jgi:hypothetical protein
MMLLLLQIIMMREITTYKPISTDIEPPHPKEMSTLIPG